MNAQSKGSKPLPGHRRGQTVRLFAVYCECDWRSLDYAGKGGLAQANREWREHALKCVTAPAPLDPAFSFRFP